MGLRIRNILLIVLLLFMEHTVLLHDLIHSHSGWTESAQTQDVHQVKFKSATSDTAPHSETKACGICLAMAGCGAMLLLRFAVLPEAKHPNQFTPNVLIGFFSRDRFDLRSRGPPQSTHLI